MKSNGLIVLSFAVAVAACGKSGPNFASLQARSPLGPTSEWKLDPALRLADVQEMRNRAYGYCLSKKPSDQLCTAEEDHSLFEYANSFRTVRLFRSEDKPTFPFAVAHKQDASAFERARRYCNSVYEDQGSRDARSLGPCMSAAIGADFFGFVPVS